MLGSERNVTSKLELFSHDELTNMPKPGRHLAASLEGQGWFVQAHFVVEGQSVVAVELSAKSATYGRPLVKVCKQSHQNKHAAPPIPCL